MIKAFLGRRQFALEQLETRAVPAAGITAVLVNGQLTVTGTDRADQIVFRRAGDTVSVQGVQGSFDANSISSIVVDAGAGNDIVRLNTQAARGGVALNVPTTIQGGAGNDTIIGSVSYTHLRAHET